MRRCYVEVVSRVCEREELELFTMPTENDVPEYKSRKPCSAKRMRVLLETMRNRVTNRYIPSMIVARRAVIRTSPAQDELNIVDSLQTLSLAIGVRQLVERLSILSHRRYQRVYGGHGKDHRPGDNCKLSDWHLTKLTKNRADENRFVSW